MTKRTPRTNRLASATASLTAENTFTAELVVLPGDEVSVSVSGVSDSTWTLQHKLDGTNWRDVDGHTADEEGSYSAASQGLLRLGITRPATTAPTPSSSAWGRGDAMRGNRPYSSARADADLTVVRAEVAEIERHLHNPERWVGLAAARAGITPYTIQVGGTDGTFGAWTAILVAGDTPIISGMTHYDPHRVLLVDVPTTKKLLLLQFAWGAVAATAYGDGDFTEAYALPEKPADGKAYPITIQFPRLAAATPLWCRALQDQGKTTDGPVELFMGIHEYEA